MLPRRLSAALLALAVFATLATRVTLNMQAQGTSLPEALWAMFRFFTIWTNAAVGLAAAWLALRGRLDGRISAGLVMAITAVGLVYHALLAHLTDFAGLELLLDHMLHSVVPVWFLAHWLAFEPKAQAGFAALPLWLAYPGVYCLYALIRAQFDGIYPYFFLDIADQGPGPVLINILGLLAGFAVLGGLIVLAARALSDRRLARQG